MHHREHFGDRRYATRRVPVASTSSTAARSRGAPVRSSSGPSTLPGRSPLAPRRPTRPGCRFMVSQARASRSHRSAVPATAHWSYARVGRNRVSRPPPGNVPPSASPISPAAVATSISSAATVSSMPAARASRRRSRTPIPPVRRAAAGSSASASSSVSVCRIDLHHLAGPGIVDELRRPGRVAPNDGRLRVQRTEHAVAAQRDRDLAGQLDGVVGGRDQQAAGDQRTDGAIRVRRWCPSRRSRPAARRPADRARRGSPATRPAGLDAARRRPWRGHPRSRSSSSAGRPRPAG